MKMFLMDFFSAFGILLRFSGLLFRLQASVNLKFKNSCMFC